MKEFKARCSSLGALYTEPRLKSESVSETLKTYLNDWYLGEVFGVDTSISSKYTDKGLQLEDEAIAAYNTVFGTNYSKNDEYFEDDFITGTPDIIGDDEIIDIKCSFSLSSFPLFESKLKNKNYLYQIQGYLRLTGKSKGKIAYVLLDTPEEIIIREAKSIMYKEKLPESFLDILIEEVRESQTYSHIPIEKRIVIFDIDRDDTIIESMPEKVLKCRGYLENLSI